MNEEYVKNLTNERKGESPFELWFEFIGYQLAFGFGILAIIIFIALLIG